MSDSQREKLIGDVKNLLSKDGKETLANAISHSPLPRNVAKMLVELVKSGDPLNSGDPLFEKMEETLISYVDKRTEAYLNFLPLDERKRNSTISADQLVPMAQFYLMSKGGCRQVIDKVVTKVADEPDYQQTLSTKVQYACTIWWQALDAIKNEANDIAAKQTEQEINVSLEKASVSPAQRGFVRMGASSAADATIHF